MRPPVLVSEGKGAERCGTGKGRTKRLIKIKIKIKINTCNKKEEGGTGRNPTGEAVLLSLFFCFIAILSKEALPAAFALLGWPHLGCKQRGAGLVEDRQCGLVVGEQFGEGTANHNISGH